MLKEVQLGPRMRVRRASKLASWVVRALKEQTPTTCTVKRVLVPERAIRMALLATSPNRLVRRSAS